MTHTTKGAVVSNLSPRQIEELAEVAIEIRTERAGMCLSLSADHDVMMAVRELERRKPITLTEEERNKVIAEIADRDGHKGDDRALEDQLQRIKDAKSLKRKMTRLRIKADRMHPKEASPLYAQIDDLQGQLDKIGG